MSSAGAEVFTPEGEFIGYSVYHGTSDVQLPFVVPEFRWAEDVGFDYWDRLKDCDHDAEPCVVYSDYGGGFYWPAKVCRDCGVLTDKLSPYGTDYGYTLPTPEQQVADDAWRKAGWPKRGHPFPATSPMYGRRHVA